jgi:drug/metabolite transporter (DMT)-like permease
MRIGPIQFLLPVIALTVAVLGLGEVLTLPLIISTVAIVGGIAVAQRS